jgi:lipopolysaccharide transport system ATP-binding protein
MSFKNTTEINSKIDYCIDIFNVSKSFDKSALSRKAYTTLKSALLGLFQKKQKISDNNFNRSVAIKDLTIRIPRGASVGVIGRNGSGKSTLLKLITGIYKPTEGHVQVQGRVAALIELGAGFHPDFTGRENLQLGAVLHGLTKQQLAERFDAIVDFAELREVIDQPVKTYSSGMFMRLGFSLAIHTDPDILLVDEVLAVGDAGFVSKCKERIAEIRKQGKTLLLVSHDLEAVERWCDEVVWLKDGKVADRGHPRRVIDHYREYIEKGEEQQLTRELEEHQAVEVSQEPNAEVDSETSVKYERWGSREVELTAIRLLNSNSEEHLLFHPSDSVLVEVEYKVNEAVDSIVFGLALNRNDGLPVFGTNTDIERLKIPALGTSGKVRFKFDRISLISGNYTLDIAAHRSDGYPYDYHKSWLEFAVRSNLNQIGVFEPQHSWEFLANA